MKQEQQTGKQMVSKSRYIALKVSKLFMDVVGLCLLLFGLGVLLAVWWKLEFAPTSSISIGFILLALLLISGCYGLARIGDHIRKQADKIDPGIPLTHANTTDLPAHDTLVRASSEPQQAQKSVLLRAANERQERQAEELVRAVNAKE